MNAPDRFELFLLDESAGEKKITETPFPGMSDTSDFLILKEDHTLGNLISEHVKKHPNVLMAGYKVAHPNVPELVLRIQTDGSKTPKEVLILVIKRLIADLGKLSREFTREYELRKIATAGANQEQADGK